MLKNLIVFELCLFYGLIMYWLIQYRIKTALKSFFILFFLIICGEHLPQVVILFMVSLVFFWILLCITYDVIVTKIIQEKRNINLFPENIFFKNQFFSFKTKSGIQINKLEQLFEKNYSKKKELCFLTACRISFILFFVVAFYIVCWEFIFIGIQVLCYFINCSDMLKTLIELVGEEKTTQIFYVLLIFKPTTWWVLKCISKRLYFNLLIILIGLNK